MTAVNSNSGEKLKKEIPSQGDTVFRVPVRRKTVSLFKKNSFRELVTSLAYVVPQYSLYLALQIIPFLLAIPMIFTNQADFLDQNIQFVGFENITSLFTPPLSDRFFPAVQRTIIFAVVNYCTVYVFGFLLALAMYELISRWKNTFFTIIYLPWMMSGIGIGFMMSMLFSRDTGTVNLLLEVLGFGQNIFDVRSDITMRVLLPMIYGWKSAGFNMALFLGGMLAIPYETIESAKLDGANYLQRVMHVYLPQIIPSIITATIFSAINSFGIFDELVGLQALWGNNNAEFLAVFIYQMGFGSGPSGGLPIGTLAQAITVSLLVFFPLMVGAFYLVKLQKKLQYY
jgi:ABC-type sugar transport system permease subunit